MQGGIEQSLAYLRGAKDVQTLGQETVRGIETTHYRATVDFELVLASLPGSERLLLEQIRERLQNGQPEYEPFDVWIDSDGYARKLAFGFSMKASGSSDKRITEHITYELYDFNAPISIELPPADQVVDMTRSLSEASAE